MRSKIEIKLKANGALEEITQGEDKIFQGAVGVTEYHLSIADGITGDYNWRPTDIVYMSLKRNDGQTAQVKMTAENGGWVWTSNGWETDVDIVGTGDLELSFICKRYSLVSVGTVAFEKTTEKIDLIVYESAGYVPQNIDIEIAEELQEAINVLQLDKVGRYSVSAENLPYLPAEIIFDLDGAKTPNNVYFDFTNDVIDYDGETREKIGAILVIANDGVQTELFLTSDGKMYSRTIDGGVTDFVSTAKVDFEFYTYSKLQADNRFVHLSGNETIADTKTFSASPIVPTPSANTHAVNRKYVTDNFYDKEQIGNLTSPISFSIEQNFMDWLAGEYVRPDGILPQDLLLGKKVIIQETGKNNYQVAYVPALSIECYKILVEDNKYASEIGFVPYKEIIATDTQEAVEQVKDEVDLKTQTTEEADLTILTTDWVLSGTDYYYDYFNANYTNQTKQRLEFISNDLTQNTTLETEQFTVRAIQTITVGETIGVRIYANLVPSIDLTFKVMLQTYTDSIIEAGIIQASAVVYDNTSGGLTATNVKAAIDELASEKINKSLMQTTLYPLEDLYAVATTSTEQYKVLMTSVGSYTPPNTPIKVAVFDGNGKLGSSVAPTADENYVNLEYTNGLVKELLTEPINLTFTSADDNPDTDGMDKGALNAGYDYKVVLTADTAFPTLEARKIEITFKDFVGFNLQNFAFTMLGYGFQHNSNIAYFGKYPFSTGDTLDIQFGACEAMCLINGTTLTFYIKKGPSHNDSTIFSPYFNASFYPHKITSVRLY